MAYNGTTEVASGLKPMGAGGFPVVNAADVYVTDEKRLVAALAEKMDTPATSGASEGDVLRINSSGNPVWTDPATPTDSQVDDAVADWLDAHPEATTTVTDGSITEAKLDDDLKEELFDKGVLARAGTISRGIASSAISSNTSGRSAYYDVDGVRKVTVTKNEGKTFTIGFTAAVPAEGDALVQTQQKNETATEMTSDVPEGAAYLVVYYYNTANGSEPGTASEMLASLSVEATYNRLNLNGAVQYGKAQSLTDAQKAQARENIGAGKETLVSYDYSAEFEIGGINVTTGADTTSSSTVYNKRIRTKGYLPVNTKEISIAEGYAAMVCQYDPANNYSYVGAWNGSAFSTSSADTMRTGSIDMRGFDQTKCYRVVAKEVNDTDPISDVAFVAGKLTFYALTDPTLTADGCPADAGETGRRFSAMTEALHEIGGSPLPTGYEQIEYIEATGGQSIMARGSTGTDQVLTANSRVVITFALTNLASGAYLFGARKTASDQAFHVTIFGGTGEIESGYGTNKKKLTKKITDTAIHTIDKDKNLLYLDGKKIATHSAWSGTANAPYNGRVGAIRTKDGLSKGKARIYRYTEYDDGIMAADLVPCKRISDGAVGMYDLLSESFRTNEVQDSDPYTAGSAPTLFEVNEKMAAVESDVGGVIADVEAIKNSIYGTAYVQEEADRVAAKVRSVQTGDTITFAAVSDLHYGVVDDPSASGVTAEASQEALKDMRDGIKAIAQQTHIDFYASFGDVIYQLVSSGVPDYDNGVQEMIGVTKLLNDAFGNNRQIRIVGNHDPNCENDQGKEFSAYMLNSFMGIYNEMLDKTGAPSYGGYGFHDFEQQKVRLIVLNTSFYSRDQDPGNHTTRYYLGPGQAKWLCGVLNMVDGTAPKQNPGEWQIFICSHVRLDAFNADTQAYMNNIGKFSQVIKAYETGEQWYVSSTYNYDFHNKNAARLAVYFNGHAHNYAWDHLRNVVYKVDSDNDSNSMWVIEGTTKMPRLTVPNALPGRDGASKDSVTYTKTEKTAESTAFLIITLDPVNKIVYAHHYGAGIDLIVHYESQTPQDEMTLTSVLTPSLSWQSNDTEVATVSDGIVEAVTSGQGGNTLIWCKSTADNCIEAWNINVEGQQQTP